MKSKNFVLGLVSFLLFYIILELFSRIALSFLGFSFFNPKGFLVDNYYKELKTPLQTDITKDDGYKDILILGGSVISPLWSRMDARLDSILSKKNVRVFDVAIPGHTSLDNAIKYELLKDKEFDLVIYYEAINENRANNTAPDLFKDDYSQMEWYHHIGLIRKHPELNFTTLPYLLHKAIVTITRKITKTPFLENDNVRKENRQYGADIKTAGPYKKNLEDIISLASKKEEKLLLMAYTSFFPDVNFLGDPSDAQYFAKNCARAAIVTVWGDTKNTKKGIEVHNDILTSLANEHKTYYLDMRKMIPQEVDCFCDICHLSEKGCAIFADALANYITTSNLLETKAK